VLVIWVKFYVRITMSDCVRNQIHGQSHQEVKNMRYSTYQLPHYTNIIPFYRSSIIIINIIIIIIIFIVIIILHFLLLYQFIFPFANYAQGDRLCVLNDDTTYKQLLVFKKRKWNQVFNAFCHWKQNCKRYLAFSLNKKHWEFIVLWFYFW
jgi:hypothetical protein